MRSPVPPPRRTRDRGHPARDFRPRDARPVMQKSYGHPDCRWPCACPGRARDWYQLWGEMAQACLSLEYSDCTR